VRGSSGVSFVNIIEGFIEGTISRGRPRRMWIDDIKECDRGVWRTMVGNLRVS